MARKPKETSDKAPSGASAYRGNTPPRIDFKFINVSANQQDIQWLLDNEEDAPGLIFQWLAELPDFYKLSCNLDRTSSRFNATLACSDPDDPNYGFILSFRGATAAAALFGLYYADYVKLEGQWKRLSVLPESKYG